VRRYDKANTPDAPRRLSEDRSFHRAGPEPQTHPNSW